MSDEVAISTVWGRSAQNCGNLIPSCRSCAPETCCQAFLIHEETAIC